MSSGYSSSYSWGNTVNLVRVDSNEISLPKMMPLPYSVILLLHTCHWGYFCEPHMVMLSTYNCLLQRGGLQLESRLRSEVKKTVNCNCWSIVATSRWCNNDPNLWSMWQSCKFLQVHKTSGKVGFTVSVWHHCHRIPWEHYWGLSPEWFKCPTSLEGSINKLIRTTPFGNGFLLSEPFLPLTAMLWVC